MRPLNPYARSKLASEQIIADYAAAHGLRYALLQREGLKPQENSGSWISQQIRKIAPGTPAKPSSSPAAVPDTAPGPVQVPVERAPAQDIPTASTTRTNEVIGPRYRRHRAMRPWPGPRAS